MPALDPTEYAAILIALLLGGILKGATGAGVPVIAAFVDVRFAVVVMIMPNLFTNMRQLWSFRADRLGGSFALKYAIAGAVGALIGTGFLVVLPDEALSAMLAAIVFAYIGLRLARPSFRVSMVAAIRWVISVGIFGGLFQGAAGISAPVSVTFLNAIRLDRKPFIFTISAFFVGMGAVQLPATLIAGLMTLPILGLSVLALIPVLASMPLGDWLGRKASPQVFDRVILIFLALLALRLASQLVL